MSQEEALGQSAQGIPGARIPGAQEGPGVNMAEVGLGMAGSQLTL